MSQFPSLINVHFIHKTQGTSQNKYNSQWIWKEWHDVTVALSNSHMFCLPVQDLYKLKPDKNPRKEHGGDLKTPSIAEELLAVEMPSIERKSLLCEYSHW